MEADDQEFYISVIDKLNEDPAFFGPTAQRRIDRALFSDGKISLKETIDDLRADREFRRKLAGLQDVTREDDDE